VQIIKLITAFLGDCEGQLKRLDAAADVWDYSERAATLVKITPGLVAREKYQEAASIARRFSAHGKEKSERAQVANSSFVDIGVGPALDDAARAFLKASKEERTVIGLLFVAMGAGSVPVLLNILDETDDVWRTKQAAEILVHIGHEAATSLVHEVEQSAMKPAAMSAIIRVLGEITDKDVGADAVKAIVPKADDVHPDVRREVLLTLSRLQPAAHFDKFVAKIGDSDTKVKKAALHGLGQSGDPRAFEKLKVIVAQAEQAGQEAAWDLAGAAIENIGALYQSCPKARADIARALPEIADDVAPKRSLKGLFKAAVPVPVDVALALATAAGRIEGPEAYAVLERLSGHWSKTVSGAAAELLKTRNAAKK
jgi:hypothetical protein